MSFIRIPTTILTVAGQIVSRYAQQSYQLAENFIYTSHPTSNPHRSNTYKAHPFQNRALPSTRSPTRRPSPPSKPSQPPIPLARANQIPSYRDHQSLLTLLTKKNRAMSCAAMPVI